MKISRLPLSLCALVLAFARPRRLRRRRRQGAGRRRGRRRRRRRSRRADYDALLAQAKKSYKNQKREFPKAGSQEFQTLKNQAVQFLVQREQFEQEADALDVEITDKQVDARLAQIQKQYFGGDKKKFEKQLKDQGLTEAQVRKDIRAQIISEKIFEEVTRDVKVTDKQVEEYYTKNKAQYSQPESREVRHILVKTKAKADDIYNQLKAGADFAALAKKYSEDTGSKANGGKLTISKGQTVAPFDQTAFLLKKNEISKPVKTEFGYHVIQPLGDVEAGQGDAAEGRQGLDPPAAGADEEERGDDEVGRRPEEGLRGQDLLRRRLHAAARRRHHRHARPPTQTG